MRVRDGPGPAGEEQLESEIFNRWLEELGELSASAPEWFEMEIFVKQMGELAHMKAGQMIVEQTESLDLVVEDTQEKFGDELGYLEIDLSGRVDDARKHPFIFPEAVAVAEALHDRLLEYMKLRPIAKTRSEELERRELREQCEDAIFGLESEWRNLVRIAMSMEEERQTDRVDGEVGVGDVSTEGEAPARAFPEMEVVGQSPAEEKVGLEGAPQAAAVMKELKEARQEHVRLQEHGQGLETERRGLEVKVSGLAEEVDRLRRELYESQQNEKLWREQFVSVSKSAGGEREEEPGEIGDVGDAVERASRAFPNELAVALNSKSDVATPFKRPEEVYSVLAWLGTEYHRARTREAGRDPQFDKLLKEACSGWFYKPKQTDETKDQFPEWYRTRLEDREYELDMHVGKGTSFDPQNTIRIAFDWDEEEKRVVVGYIGRHQKNRRS